ncbi:hypothetical protein HZZ00_25385 [Streptomyces sp. NEAU-sy36]|uniref:hypothetical protein n=1 Tax=unclassified Streptomyces TaxID=2593676 RepID=UPI0015D5DE3E|nr:MULTISPECIES: hypothetical protein [unclassified Streptomyces]QLJ03999.1 hypothetical protein HZZ00_25385 [Streptomyces sp. NEAU-sy36]
MSRPRVVIVGAGLGGYRAGITPPNPADHFPYPPLPPQVAAGIVEARRVAVPLPGRPEVVVSGAAAAVPGVGEPGALIATTARHAWRRGRLAGRDAPGLGRRRRPYRHREPGFAVDPGGARTAACPVGRPAVRTGGRRGRPRPPPARLAGRPPAVAADRPPGTVLPRQGGRFGPVRSRAAPPNRASPRPPREPPGAPAR